MTKILNKNNLGVFLCIFAFLTLCMLPIISSLTYSIDDYHLWSVYDLNLKNMGYATYDSGRDVQGILMELLYFLNLQPINKPLGSLLFIASLGIMGTYLVNELKIEKNSYRIIVSLIFAANPFLLEMYYYSTVTIYYAFSLIFLWIAFKSSMKYSTTGLFRYALVSVLFYVLSLGISQNFYSLGIVFLFICIINDRFAGNVKFSKYFRFILVYLLSFVLYFVILKVKFFICPPSTVYQDISVLEFIKELGSSEYWCNLYDVVIKYLFTNNVLNSSLIYIISNVFTLILLLIYVIKCRKKASIINALIVALYMLVMQIVNVGIGLVRLDNVSGRCFTTVGLYVASLFYISVLILYEIKLNRIVIGCLCSFYLIVCVTFGGLCGRASINLMRLNSLEANTINRIVYRMEENPDFTGREALYIYGVPELGQYNKMIGLGNFCTPALCSFSKVLLANETTGYSFEYPNAEQYMRANEIVQTMDTWPSENSVIRENDMYIVRLYW